MDVLVVKVATVSVEGVATGTVVVTTTFVLVVEVATMLDETILEDVLRRAVELVATSIVVVVPEMVVPEMVVAISAVKASTVLAVILAEVCARLTVTLMVRVYGKLVVIISPDEVAAEDRALVNCGSGSRKVVVSLPPLACVLGGKVVESSPIGTAGKERGALRAPSTRFETLWTIVGSEWVGSRYSSAIYQQQVK